MIRGIVFSDARCSADRVTLSGHFLRKYPVGRRMRKRWLKSIEAIIQRQQRVSSKCDDHCLLSFSENG
jgi:hypothetical protein